MAGSFMTFLRDIYPLTLCTITSVVDYYYMRSRRAEAFILFHSLVLLRVGLSWLMNVGLWIEKEPQPKYNVVIEWILDLPCFEPRKVGIDKSHCLVFYFHNFQAQTIIIYYINISEIRTPNDCCSVKVYKNVAPSPRKWWWERSII